VLQYWFLIPLGFVIGSFGTMIGVGGGFVLMPILLFLYPNESPAIITSITLAVSCCNATSGSIAYARMGRIDYRSATLFTFMALPGAIVGAYATDYISRRCFDFTFGVAMIVLAGFLFVSRTHSPGEGRQAAHRWSATRRIVERDGTVHEYSFDSRLGAGIAGIVGFVSSILGLGGGIIHVPAMARLLSFPVHLATATSHLMVAVMTLAATVVHLATGSFSHGFVRTVLLVSGVLLGAPFGARFSSKVKGGVILKALAAALAVVGARLLVGSV